MTPITFICGSGGLGGAGVHAESLERSLERNPSFIAADCGSTDGGPYSLGSGKPAYSRASVKRDLKLLMQAGRRLRIPVILGSAGTAGADVQVNWVLDIAREIATELDARVSTAVIYAEQDKDYLKQMMREGRVTPLENAPEYDEAVIDRSAHIVGMMATEQLQKALEREVDLVIAGRCSDSALFAAFPVMHGYPAGLAWHAGKILECGMTACVNKGKGIMTATLSEDDLVISPVGPNMRCSPQSVAAHSLYENGDPWLHKESSGTLDMTRSTIDPVDDVSVRITGTNFVPSDDYTIKLEGAELRGYQTVMIFGIRDPYMIESLDTWIAEIREIVDDRIALVAPEVRKEDYTFVFRVYGRNGVMGDLEPRKDSVPHEVGVVLEITAPTQELATTFATLSRQPLLHHYIPKWSGSITGIAQLGSPAYMERGAVYGFNVNHVVHPRDPHEMFRTNFLQLN